MPITIPSSGISFTFILQLIFEASSRSFSKLRWRLTRNGETENTVKIKNKDFSIIIKRDGNYYSLRYSIKPEDGGVKTGKLRITGQELSQVIDAVTSRIFR